MSRVSRRSLVARLEATRVDAPLSDVFADDLAARLQSLAVAASFEVGATKGRYRRKFVAAIGSIGVIGWIGWIGVTGAAASVGLASTGNLPAPVQDVVSSVFGVVGIELPTSDENEPAPVEEPSTIDIEETPVDSTVPVEDSAPLDPTTPVETTIPATDVTGPGETIEEPPVSSSRPGNSGSTPAVTAPGQIGNPGNPGNSGNTPGATAPGQSKKDEAVSDVVVDEKPSVTAPGQSNKDNKATPPGQVKKSGDESGSAKKKSD